MIKVLTFKNIAGYYRLSGACIINATRIFFLRKSYKLKMTLFCLLVKCYCHQTVFDKPYKILCVYLPILLVIGAF